MQNNLLSCLSYVFLAKNNVANTNSATYFKFILQEIRITHVIPLMCPIKVFLDFILRYDADLETLYLRNRQPYIFLYFFNKWSELSRIVINLMFCKALMPKIPFQGRKLSLKLIAIKCIFGPDYVFAISCILAFSNIWNLNLLN